MKTATKYSPLRMSRGTVSLKALVLLLCLFALGVGTSLAAPAPDTNSVLILGSTVKTAASSVEATQAAAAGFTVVVATDADWSAMATSDFASYKEIIFGDGMCSGSATLNAAVANQSVWGPAITGNVIVIGSHPSEIALMTPNARNFVQTALTFGAAAQGTGAYINLGCYMSPSQTINVAVLQPFGQFSVVRQNGCSTSAHLIASDPNLSALSDANMSGWTCTTNVEFANWDTSFLPLVEATDVGGNFVDPSTAATVSPYILVRGSQVTALTTLQAAPSNPPPTPPPPAPGDPTVNLSTPMSGEYDFFNAPINLVTGDGNWGFKGDLKAFLNWAPQSTITLNYDSNHVDQGDTPGMVDTLNPGHGNMCLGVDATLDAVVDGNDLSLGGVSQNICGDCPLNISGSTYACTLDEQYIQLFCGGIGLVDACISLTLSLDSNPTPEPFDTDRTVFYAGTPGTGPDPLDFPPNPEPDPFKISCVQPAGADAVYQLANPRTSPVIGFSAVLGVAGQICELCIGDSCANCNTVVDVPLYTFGPFGNIPLNLTGPNGQTDLGPVQKENTPPDLTAVQASYSGNEGSPIQFSSTGAKDNCLDYSSLVWNFSDEGVAYGSMPYHTFQGPDIYSGQLVVTNVGGLTGTKAFSVNVADVPPVVTAGPNVGAPWGVPVAFNGSATAGGTTEQATLVYSWTFGDGSPSATGGPSVTHPYSAPGPYTVTLKVCDQDNNCSSANTQAVIRKRNVSLGYLGDQQGVYNTLTNLSGSLVDELGSVVPGRTIVFAIGAEAGGSAATNSAGIASTTHLLGLGAGSYMASATFAGDSLYNAAAPSTAAYTVYKKPTSVTYTGTLTGGPNKIITLSAVLVDSQNNPLAGRMIAFNLGSQSASATTNASGVAATTLKLNQKNGSYPLTATFTPAGADVNLYLGSVASATFKLQSK